MKNINAFFNEIKEIKANAANHVNDCKTALDKLLAPFFDDHSGLQTALKELCNAKEYGIDEGGVYGYVSIDLADFKESEEHPCLLDALDRYLSDQDCSYLDRDNDVLIDSYGETIIINHEGDVYSSDANDNNVIIKASEYTVNGEKIESYRNFLIERHMEKTGCFPGVYSMPYEQDNCVYGVDTRCSMNTEKCDYCEQALNAEENCPNCNAKIREKAVTGVTSEAGSLFFDLMYQNDIDIAYLDQRQELKEQGLSDEQIDDELQDFESESGTHLVGDWVKVDGKYQIDYKGKNGFAATYCNQNGNIVCVEFSRITKNCHHTSPCYRMTDGSPCGDLDTEGDSVLAYALPDDLMGFND